jgi:hypothetical protein
MPVSIRRAAWSGVGSLGRSWFGRGGGASLSGEELVEKELALAVGVGERAPEASDLDLARVVVFVAGVHRFPI